jgi:hypothetical protein
MKYIIFIITLCLLAACQTTNQLKPVSQIKPSVAKEGSLANKQLINDATNALIKLPNNYAAAPDAQMLKFVIQQPVGNPGERAWREMWIAKTDTVSKSYIITFKEQGLEAANFEINPMSNK